MDVFVFSKEEARYGAPVYLRCMDYSSDGDVARPGKILPVVTTRPADNPLTSQVQIGTVHHFSHAKIDPSAPVRVEVRLIGASGEVKVRDVYYQAGFVDQAPAAEPDAVVDIGQGAVPTSRSEPEPEKIIRPSTAAAAAAAAVAAVQTPTYDDPMTAETAEPAMPSREPAMPSREPAVESAKTAKKKRKRRTLLSDD